MLKSDYYKKLTLSENIVHFLLGTWKTKRENLTFENLNSTSVSYFTQFQKSNFISSTFTTNLKLKILRKKQRKRWFCYTSCYKRK